MIDEHSILGGLAGEHGSGNTIREDRHVGEFDAIDAGWALKVNCKVGEATSLSIEGDDNILKLIESKVEDGTLRLRATKPFNTKNPITVTITTPHLNRLNLSGAARADVKNIQSKNFQLEASGASKVQAEGSLGDLDLNLSGASNADLTGGQMGKVKIDSSGASRLEIKGTADRVDMVLNGASRADLDDMKAHDAKVALSGASRVQLTASGEVTGDASGASRIEISGTRNVSVHTSGASSVKSG